MNRSRAAWLLLCAGLAACEQTERAEPVVAPPASETADAAPVEPAPPPPDAPDPKPETLVALPDGDPEMLLKRDTAEMADLLGTPTRIEDVPPAIIWVYEMQNVCSLKLFFYPELEGTRYVTLTYEITPAGDARAEEVCISALRRAHVG